MPRSMLAMLRLLGVIALMATAFAMPAYVQDDNQDDDDTQGDDVVAEATELGVYIYEGTVDDFGEEPVDEVGALELLSEDDDDPDDETEEIWQAIGDDGERPEPFYGDDTDADLTLDEVTGEPHVLAVHAGEEADEPVIAAGSIEGDVEDGTLVIDLQPVDDSGYEGRAFFGPNDDDDDTGQEDPGDVDDTSGGEAGGEDDDDDDEDDDVTDVLIGLWQATTGGV